MEIFLLFLFFATLILGILCLIVLEYQNQRSKRWLQTLPRSAPSPSQYHPPPKILAQKSVRTQKEQGPPKELSPAQVA